jgi:LuxR family maltose regulon positive regulatory protein
MSRALRYAPPLANRGLIVRPRLLANLQTRFERPLTAIVAAPGFGKTTLLAQAVRENALAPVGPVAHLPA